MTEQNKPVPPAEPQGELPLKEGAIPPHMPTQMKADLPVHPEEPSHPPVEQAKPEEPKAAEQPQAPPAEPTPTEQVEVAPQAQQSTSPAPQQRQVTTAKDPFEAFTAVAERISKLQGRKWFEREASFMMQIVAQSDFLRQTSPTSRLQAFVQLANIGLSLDPTMKLVYLIPRKVSGEWKCMLEPSYMGLIKVATDTGSIKLMRAEIVYEGDDISIVKGTQVAVQHVPYWRTGRAKGEVIAAYSVAVLHDGTVDVLDMGREELDKIKGVSEAVKAGRKSPHDLWGDEMMRKAPIRRHLKTLPKTERMEALMQAIAADEQHFNVQQQALPQAPQRALRSALDGIKEEVFELFGALTDPEKYVWLEEKGAKSFRHIAQDASKDLAWWQATLEELKAATQQQ